MWLWVFFYINNFYINKSNTVLNFIHEYSLVAFKSVFGEYIKYILKYLTNNMFIVISKYKLMFYKVCVFWKCSNLRCGQMFLIFGYYCLNIYSILEDEKNTFSYCSYTDYTQGCFLSDSKKQTKKTLQVYIGCWKYSWTHFKYIPNLLEFGSLFLAQFHTEICKSIIRICFLVHYVQKELSV